MDPILVAAVRKLREAGDHARQDGVVFDDGELETFLREETGGKYGLQDARRLLSSIDTGVGARNVGRSVAQGALLGFADELAGLGAALVPGGKGYREARDESRLRHDRFKQAHPRVALGSEIVGGVVLPAGSARLAARAGVAGGRAALPLATRLARGAKLGGSFGAAAGVGHAEEMRDIPAEALKGGAGGAVVGSALDAVVAPVVGGVVRSLSPRAAAANRLAGAVEASGSIAEVEAARRAAEAAGRGAEITVGDLAAPLRAEAEYVATNSPAGRRGIGEIVERRQAGAADRVLGDVQRALGNLGDTPVASRLKQLRAERQAWARKAYGTLSEAPVEDLRPFLEQATADPAVSAQLTKAQQTGLIGPVQDTSPLSFQHLHDVQQALDDMAKTAFRSGQGNLGRRLAAARNELVGNLEEQFPHFREVSQEYARRIAQEKMLLQGDKIASQLFDRAGAHDTRQLAQWVSQLPTDQLTELRRGMAARFTAMLRAGDKNKSVAAQIDRAGPAMQDRLEVLFGDHATFDRFMTEAAHEARLAELAHVLGGSATARRLAQAPDIGVLRNLLNFNFADAALSLGRGRSPHAVADALAPDMTVKGSAAVQRLLRALQQRSAARTALQVGADAASGNWFGGLLGDALAPTGKELLGEEL